MLWFRAQPHLAQSCKPSQREFGVWYLQHLYESKGIRDIEFLMSAGYLMWLGRKFFSASEHFRLSIHVPQVT